MRYIRRFEPSEVRDSLVVNEQQILGSCPDGLKGVYEGPCARIFYSHDQ